MVNFIHQNFNFKIVFSILISLVFLNLKAQNFSPKSEISILTVSPGEELFNAFGHSGIRVNDTINKIDRVYNYGMFNFGEPNFYTNFIKGKLLYSLGLQRTSSFLNHYKSQNRQVTEQVLLLNSTENESVINFLQNNYKPENRKYLYDFFYDNCSSRIRDVLESELPNLKYAFADKVENKPTKSFREMLDIYTHNNGRKWADFGMDLILGMPSDKICDKRNQMFLPDFLSTNIENVKNGGQNLLTKTQIITAHTKKPFFKNFIITPFVAMCILLIVTTLVTFFIKSSKFQNVFDYLFFGILGISGLLFLLMWLFTDHVVCHKNWNMLWANPFYLLGIIFTFKQNWYWQLILIITAFVFVCFPFIALNLHPFKIIPQQMHLAFVPILMSILLRCFYRLKLSNMIR